MPCGRVIRKVWLNPRKADLRRWRETFAEKLKGYGVETEATRQATRCQSRNPDALCRLKAKEEGRLRKTETSNQVSSKARAFRSDALGAWLHIGQTLAGSADAKEANLARSIAGFIRKTSAPPERSRTAPDVDMDVLRSGPVNGPDIHR
jgi:hypothetical protein